MRIRDHVIPIGDHESGGKQLDGRPACLLHGSYADNTRFHFGDGFRQSIGGRRQPKDRWQDQRADSD
jgi:hypothetical protein